MGAYRIGSEYIGSSDIETSIADTEVIPSGKTLYKFSMKILQEAHISINNGTPIYMAANSKFETSVEDEWLYSLKFSESGIKYHWVGAI
jgi:hypothetical protein